MINGMMQVGGDDGVSSCDWRDYAGSEASDQLEDRDLHSSICDLNCSKNGGARALQCPNGGAVILAVSRKKRS
jgi:hypothetical protein